MRLFAAVIPPGTVRRELAAAVEELTAAPDRLAPDGAAAGPRWTPPEGRHITLAFYGEVDGGTLPGLTERLARAAHRHGPATLRLAGGGRFGDHVLWTGVAGDTAALARLAASVTAAARRCGIAVDADRAYRPHVTLARQRGSASLRPYAEALASFSSTPWTADRLHLLRSHPPAPGVPGARPAYESLGEWELGG